MDGVARADLWLVRESADGHNFGATRRSAHFHKTPKMAALAISQVSAGLLGALHLFFAFTVRRRSPSGASANLIWRALIQIEKRAPRDRP